MKFLFVAELCAVLTGAQQLPFPPLPALPVNLPQMQPPQLQCAGIWHLQGASSATGNQRLVDAFTSLNSIQLTISPSGANNGLRSDALVTLMLGNVVSVPIRLHNGCTGEIEILGNPVLRNPFGWRPFDPADPMTDGLQILSDFLRHLVSSQFTAAFGMSPATLILHSTSEAFMGSSNIALQFTRF
eukprot:Gregarina_sp_Poly_1__9678@NODE_613_length_7139_cov_25_137868_g469_i0_p4_GENE_NODE_613_length_7139_cov_25_137868_g469_i0NODE_613_length_7139_cov_25_137868_g469_i0_p4_ORF_typecomplete_len186_score24_32_NODE_613_length_7139_cov_25_137868_g469_i064717028